MKILLGLLKPLLVPILTEKALLELLMFGADMIVKSTKTKHDDAFLEKVKEIYEGE